MSVAYALGSDRGEDDQSLVEELLAVDPGNRWEPLVYLTGSVAHYYPYGVCPDMKQTAKPYHGIDPTVRRKHGPNACKYCFERWQKEKK